MAYLKDFMLPPTGEQIDAARLVAWTVQPGESFAQGQTLLEIETDKSVIEIPAEEDGTMIEHLVKVDGTLNADTAVARIEVAGQAPEEAAAGAAPSAQPAPAAEARAATPSGKDMGLDLDAGAGMAAAATKGGARPQGRTAATPSARRLARESGVLLETLTGTGPGGRITQGDVAAALGTRESLASGAAASAAATPGVATPGVVTPESARRAARGPEAYSVHTALGELFLGRWVPAAPRDAATVVLIHGLFGDMDTWAGTINALTRAGLRVLAMDLPCHGKSTADAAAMDEVVEAVAEAVSRETSGPLALVGHSFGAAVAARLAGKLGMRLHALALIAPMGLGTEIQQAFLDGMIHAAATEALERELRKLTEAGVGLSAAYLQDLGDRLQSRKPALIGLCSALSSHGVQQIDTTAELRALNCRTMIVHGRRDAIIPWRHALNAPPRAALHLLPGVGHMPQWEAASLTADLVLDLVVR